MSPGQTQTDLTGSGFVTDPISVCGGWRVHARSTWKCESRPECPFTGLLVTGGPSLRTEISGGPAPLKKMNLYLHAPSCCEIYLRLVQGTAYGFDVA